MCQIVGLSWRRPEERRALVAFGQRRRSVSEMLAVARAARPSTALQQQTPLQLAAMISIPLPPVGRVRSPLDRPTQRSQRKYANPFEPGKHRSHAIQQLGPPHSRRLAPRPMNAGRTGSDRRLPSLCVLAQQDSGGSFRPQTGRAIIGSVGQRGEVPCGSIERPLDRSRQHAPL